MEKKNSYNGYAYGGGISYGYQLYVSPRWNVEFTAGFPKGDAPIGKFRNEYWGLTKAIHYSSFRERIERGDWPKLALQKCEKLESDSKPYL